jgi:WD40 repeat protein
VPSLAVQKAPEEFARYGLPPRRVYGSLALRHGPGARHVATTSDGAHVVTHGGGRTVVWSAEDGHLVRSLWGALPVAGSGGDLALVPDGSWQLVHLAEDGARTETNVPDDTHILAAGMRNQELILVTPEAVSVRSTTDGRQVDRHELDTATPGAGRMSASVLPGGHYVAVSRPDLKMNRLTVLDVMRGSPVVQADIEYGAPAEARLDGDRLVARANMDNTLGVYSLENGRRERLLADSEKAVDFDAHDGAVAIASNNLLLYAPEAERPRSIELPGGPVRSVRFTSDGARLLATTDAGLFVVSADTVDARLPQRGGIVGMSADGSRILGVSRTGRVRAWAADDLRPVLDAPGPESPVIMVATTPGAPADEAGADGPPPGPCDLAVRTMGGCYWVWNERGRTVLRMEAYRQFADSMDVWDRNLALSHDGRLMVTGAEHGGDALVWHAESAQILQSLQAGTQGTMGVALSADSAYLAACLQPERMVVWEMATRKPVVSRVAWTTAPAFRPGGGRVGWVLPGRERVETCAVPTSEDLTRAGKSKWHFAWSPDGKRVAGGRAVWQADTGKELCKLEQWQTHPRQYAFSPDGKTLAVLSKTGKVRLHDSRSGAVQATLQGPMKVRSIAYHPRTGELLTGMNTGGVITWSAHHTENPPRE